MLEEVLSAVSKSEHIHRTVIVSKDELAFSIAKKYNAVQIIDEGESGVNQAVALAERYLIENGFDTSVVLPQDIPLVRPKDIAALLAFQKRPNSVLIVPSRRFDGTNALVRNPVNVMETHYDEDSYKIHLTTGKSRSIPTSFVLIGRIMLDVDDMTDVRMVMSDAENTDLAVKMSRALAD